MALALLPGYAAGRSYAIARTAAADALATDARKGVPPGLLAERHYAGIYPDKALLAQRLDVLRRTRRSIFERVDSSGGDCGRRSLLDLSVVSTNDVAWESPTATATGADPYVELDLGPPRHICALEVTFTVSRGSPGSGALTGYWMRSGVNVFSGTERMETLAVLADNAEHTATYWVDGVVDRLRLDPDSAPSSFTIKRIVVVEP